MKRSGYAKEIAVEYETLQRYRSVARAYEKRRRRRNLSYTHHQEMAGRDDRLEWLARAEAERWSVRALRGKVPEEERAAVGALSRLAAFDVYRFLLDGSAFSMLRCPNALA